MNRALRYQQLESRRLLAAGLEFAVHDLRGSMGRAENLALMADLDGDQIDDMVAYSFDSGDSNAGWFRFDEESGRFQFAGHLPSQEPDTFYRPK